MPILQRVLVFTPDDFLGETFTNETGYFFISGEEVEFEGIDPYICVEYGCPHPIPGQEVIYAILINGERDSV